MLNHRKLTVLFLIACALAIVIPVSAQQTSTSKTSESEKTLWELERSYWHYVETNDLPAYLNLWNQDFVGWPSVSDVPVRKKNITEWITSQTGKGLVFHPVRFEPAAIQVSGDVAVTYYWETFKWVSKDGRGSERTLRVTHTWRHDGKRWEIIAGMSMPEAEKQK
jgi:ketosteroid isomerase-like protein